MKHLIFRLARLVFGLFLYALGIVVTINANIGYSPWDVFHVGLANTVGISLGLASIVSGVVFVIAGFFLGEKLGLGTLLNMVLIGIFIDFLMRLKLIPFARNFIIGIPAMLAGLCIISLASFFYIGSGFGAGPRDSLMVALKRKTGLPVGLCRGAIELLAVLVGWRLGGMLGVGTIIAALGIGLCVQLTFKLLKFDPTAVRHETLGATLRNLRSKSGSHPDAGKSTGEPKT